ncbi:MAG: helix-turn-helix domain-containing protein [Candidatus Scalindua sp.]|nr:helix-turn-helix domain-containing protein [Candidatus Scalindua sp.]
MIRGRKIRNVPVKEQNEILRKCLGIHRHIYNECVDLEK